MVSTEQVIGWLGDVADPEIPAISIVDLGIVRQVAWRGDTCEVVLTPTYSGCPATTVIANAVRDTLHAHGVGKVAVATQLAPAWSTDWISAKGRAALKESGIAPPAAQAVDISSLFSRSSPAVACPRCGAQHTRLVSQFGSTACKALYQCLDCREPFDYFKPH